MIKCRRCGSSETDYLKESGYVKCRKCGTVFLPSAAEMLEDVDKDKLSKFDKIAERLADKMVSETRFSRIERLAGEILASTLPDRWGPFISYVKSLTNEYEPTHILGCIKIAEYFIEVFDKWKTEQLKQDKDKK